MNKMLRRLEKVEAALKSVNESGPIFHTLMVAKGEDIPRAEKRYAEMVAAGEIRPRDRCVILANEGHIAAIGPVGGNEGPMESRIHVVTGRGPVPLTAEEWMEKYAPR
jgi:hypothetical protein